MHGSSVREAFGHTEVPPVSFPLSSGRERVLVQYVGLHKEPHRVKKNSQIQNFILDQRSLSLVGEKLPSTLQNWQEGDQNKRYINNRSAVFETSLV